MAEGQPGLEGRGELSEHVNGKKPVQVTLSPPQMAALVLLERRIMDLNGDVGTFKQLGAGALFEAVTKATEDLSRAHEAYLAETQRAVKLASPGDLPRLVPA